MKEESMQIKHSGGKKLLVLANKQRMLLLTIVMLVVMCLTIPRFGTSENLLKIVRQVACYGIIGVGMTFVIMTGGIDLSVGPIVALGGIVAGTITQTMPLSLAIIAAVVVGCVVGAVNGVLVSAVRMLPFVATMGMMNIVRATSMLVTNGLAVWGLSDDMLQLASGYVWVFPIPVIIMVAIFIIAAILLNQFSIGRYFLAVGGNEEAARLAGVNTRFVKFLAYVICGALSAFSGVILAGRLGTAQPAAGDGYELTVIAAVVVGGTSLLGGVGTMLGTLWGTLILGLVNSALNQIGMQQFWQTLITGVIVLAAVMADMLRKDR